MERLPNELIAHITDLLDDYDLQSLHSASRELRLASDAAFKNRLCKVVYVDVSLPSLEKWSKLLHFGKKYEQVETLIITSRHVPEILDPDWPNDGLNNNHRPSKEALDEFRQLQRRPEYAQALEEQHHLLDSGRFVSHVVAMLKQLPNITRFKVDGPSYWKRSWQAAKLVTLFSGCSNYHDRFQTITDFIRSLSTCSSDHECERAASILYSTLHPISDPDQRIMQATWLVDRMRNQNDDDRKLTVKKVGDGGRLHDRFFGMVDLGFRTPDAILPGSREIQCNIIAAAIAIECRSNHLTKKVGISIGGWQSYTSFWHRDLIEPAHIAPTGTIDTCDAASLELTVGWPLDWDLPGVRASAMGCLDSFMQQFPLLTELELSGVNNSRFASLGVIASICRIDTLKRLSLKHVYALTEELASFLQPGQWQNLEKLSMYHVFLEPLRDAELAAWTRFLTGLEALPNFISLELNHLYDPESICIDIGDPPEENGVKQTFTRDPGCSWNGRLSALPDTMEQIPF